MPDNINFHHNRIVSRFRVSANSLATVKSAIELAGLVVLNENMLKKHRKLALKHVMWLLSEVDGKYTTRYRSKAVVELARADSCSTASIQHEHVFSRAAMADELLSHEKFLAAHPHYIGRFLSRCIGCVVLKTEHEALTRVKNAKGWERYRNVEVYDMSSSPPSIADTSKLQSQVLSFQWPDSND